MDDTNIAILLGRLTDIERALDIGIHIAIWCHIGVRNGDQCCKVEDDVDIFCDVFAVVRVTDITSKNFDFVFAVDVFQPTPIIEGVVLGEGFYVAAFSYKHFC